MTSIIPGQLLVYSGNVVSFVISTAASPPLPQLQYPTIITIVPALLSIPALKIQHANASSP